MRKMFVLFVFIFSFFTNLVFSQSSVEQNVASVAFIQGTTAFKSGEWMSAVFMLRRAVSYPDNFNDEDDEINSMFYSK